MRKIELDWITFPNLRVYPPNRENGKDEWWWESDGVEVDVDYVRGAQYSGHYDEYDYEGSGYDDNFYEPEDASLYPSFNLATTSNTSQPLVPTDPFGFSSHYPFSDPARDPEDDDDDAQTVSSQDEITTKLDLLVDMEVTPLFTYLASPTFDLSSITLPLYFISKTTYHNRNVTRPGYALPLKLRYWVRVAVHALLMLYSPCLLPSSTSQTTAQLSEVRVKYQPWDIWASMDPSDDLHRLVNNGVWFGDGEDEREGEGEAFKAVWHELAERGVDVHKGGLNAHVTLVKWEGDLNKWRVGDELEVVFTRSR